jgi:hypothetical protein
MNVGVSAPAVTVMPSAVAVPVVASLIMPVTAVLIVAEAPDLFMTESPHSAGKAVVIDEHPWATVGGSPVPSAVIEHIVAVAIIDHVIRAAYGDGEAE